MEITVVIRVFLKPEQASAAALEELVQKARNNAERITSNSDFSVLLLVPTDYDFGGTEDTLRAALGGVPNVSVLGAPGHHSSAALNIAAGHAYTEGATHVVFFSGKAGSYFTAPLAARMVNQFDAGDAAVGVFIKELAGNQPVPFQNTFGGYEISALRSAGGFTSDKGVEEMSVIADFVRRGLPVSVLPADDEAKLEIRKHGGAADRHTEVKDTKVERQLSELARVGSSPEEVNAGINFLS